ncbi:MAG: hypothetical protein ABDI19_08680 [Armatimonadota bacterium]
MRNSWRIDALLLVTVLLTTGMVANAQRVYLFGTGYPSRDNALYDALTAHGLQVTRGVPYRDFDGSQSLNPYQVAVLAGAGNHDDMPLAGQDVLIDWVRNGGGLVTLEWTLWAVGAINRFLRLRILFPAVYWHAYNYRDSIAYLRHTPDPLLNQGLGTYLLLGAGHEASIVEKPGAVRYYRTDYPYGGAGVVGWSYENGRVISFSVAVGYALDSLSQNPNMRQLLANAVRWAARTACTETGGDVNRDGCVDDADLLMVLFNFGATGADPADTNCDGIVDDADLLIVLFNFGTGGSC